MAKTKQNAPHVRDDPRVAAATRKRSELQQQLVQAREAVQKLATDRGSDVEHEAQGLIGTAVATAPPSIQLNEARQREQALRRAIELQDGEIRKLQLSAAAAVHNELQGEFDERVLAIVHAIADLWSATRGFSELQAQAVARGAGFPPDGTFVDPYQRNVLKLPQPAIADRCYKSYLQHLRIVHPRLSAEIDGILKDMK